VIRREVPKDFYWRAFRDRLTSIFLNESAFFRGNPESFFLPHRLLYGRAPVGIQFDVPEFFIPNIWLPRMHFFGG